MGTLTINIIWIAQIYINLAYFIVNGVTSQDVFKDEDIVRLFELKFSNA